MRGNKMSPQMLTPQPHIKEKQYQDGKKSKKTCRFSKLSLHI